MATALDEMQIVASFRAGDHEAFAELVRAHGPALHRHAMRRLNDHASAEDAVQETFARAFRALGRVEGDYRLGSWLHQIMANVCIDEANRRKREATKVERFIGVEPTVREESPGVEDQLGLDADHTAVVAALHTLPAPYREALSLRFVEECDYDEVARRTGVSEQNARARVSRGRHAMRIALRGVAAIPLFFVALLRRGGKAAEALSVSNATSSTATTAAHNAGSIAPVAQSAPGTAQIVTQVAAQAAPLTQGATAATQVATQAAPLAQGAAQVASSGAFQSVVDVAQQVAVVAPQAMPTLSKAALGIGMMVVATSPTTAPVVMNTLRTERPAAQVAVVEPAAPTDPLVTAGAGALAATATEDGATTEVAASSTDSNTAATGDAAAPVGATPAVDPSDSSTETGTRAGDGTENPVAQDGTANDAGTEGAVATEDPATSPDDTTEVVDTPETTVPAIPESERTGGHLVVGALAVTVSGPRIDVSGPSDLDIGGDLVAGSLTGRLSIDDEAEADGRHRLEGTMTVSLADGRRVAVRLAGFAQGSPDAPREIAGLFRASSDTVALSTAGSFSGTLDTASGSTLTLRLSPES